MSGPLTGIRVIDLTSVAMGPFAAQILGDMGADVIKVESPEGDMFRHAGSCRNPGMGAGFLNLNRNKRSIVLDLNAEGERRIMIDLVTRADVFLYSVRPQWLRKLGLGYEALQERNPRLIYCGAYGFSENGPYQGRPAYDDVIQAMSGVAALQGHNNPDGPRYVNGIMADKTTALTAVYAISMALFERERSGLGQSIEVPMFETLVAFNMVEHLAGETFCPPVCGTGYRRVLSVHRKPYPTKDGCVGFLPYTTAHWTRFFEIAGAPHYAVDERFVDAAARSTNTDELYRILAELIAERTTAEWVELLVPADIPFTPVLSPEDLLVDPHLEAIGFFERQRHPTEGEIRTIGIPVHFSRTPGAIRGPAPKLDQHRDEILRELD